MVVHEDIKDTQSTLASLSHTASTIVTVKPLSTGMSAEIEAQIEVYRRSIRYTNSVEEQQHHQRLGYCEHSIPRVSR
jgi:exonuclease VII large subunit